MRAWVRFALRLHDPEAAVASKAVEMLTTGRLSREAVLSDLSEALEAAQSAHQAQKATALRNVIDRMIGWSSLEASLERIGESENSDASVDDGGLDQ
jgi:hypothetical protein